MSLDSITVIGNGVERPFFEGRKGAYPADGMQRVVFAGNLASYQGVDLLLQAFVHVSRSRQDVKLTMVTDSPTAEFAAQARALGLSERVEFVESDLQQLPDLLASGDVLVNPRTRCPGVPQKLLNYMASGTPVVSFAGSTRYIVDGHSGVVISNENVEEFAAGILRLLADGTLRSALGTEAKRYAAEKLSWSATAMSLEAVYARLLSERQLQAAQSSTR
jgi:glycosyltransferase involved in cell wall biosynthesis